MLHHANFVTKGGNRTFAALCIEVCYAERSQPVNATHALKRSAGVSYPSVIRGRSLIFQNENLRTIEGAARAKQLKLSF
jgi:hypothetical protein